MSAIRGSSSADQSLPVVEFPRSPIKRGARRRAGTPAAMDKFKKACLHPPASAHVHDMDLLTANVESAVGDVCGAHDMGLPTVNVESAVGDVCDPHDMPIVEVESAVGGGVCSPWKRTCTADDLLRW